MVSNLTILVVLAGALSVAMSAPNRNYGGVYEDRPGQGHLGTVETSGQSGGVYDQTPGHGQLGVVGQGHLLGENGHGQHHHQGHRLGENGHGQQHQGHRLGENGHGQLGYHSEPGQEIGHGQHGGQYTEHSHGGTYQQQGY